MSDESLTPWLPQRQRIHDGTETHPTLQGGKSGERGFNVPNLLLSESEACSQGSAASTSDSKGPVCASCGNAKPTSTGGTCCGNGSEPPASLTWETWAFKANSTLDEQLDRTPGMTKQERFLVATFSAEGSPAKTSPSPDDAKGSPGNGQACSSSSPGSQTLFDLDSFSSRTYPGSSPRTAVGTSESCLERWPTSGTAWDGGFSTHVSSECRSDEDGCSSSECSLADVLEANVPEKYSLSARAAQGILRRAEKRGRTLPSHLSAALGQVAQTTTTDSKAV